jgi:hypothetical protein
MPPTKTLQEREKDLRSLLTTTAGQEQIQELASRYHATSDRLRPAGTSAVTYILVHERAKGLIRT